MVAIFTLVIFIFVCFFFSFFLFTFHEFSETFGFIDSTSNGRHNTHRIKVRRRSVRSAAPPVPAIARGPFTLRPPTSTMTTSFGEHPYFDFELQRNVTVTVGQTGFLHCRVEQLGDKDVSISMSTFNILHLDSAPWLRLTPNVTISRRGYE